jgi:hypothetical protein
MDFDFGNIIYIIATLIAVFAGLFGNKKKKPGKGGSPAAGEEGDAVQPGVLENLERFLSGGQAEPEVVDLPDYEDDLPAEEVDPAFAESTAASEEPSGILADYERLMSQKSEAEIDAMLEAEEDKLDQLEVIELGEGGQGSNYFEIIENFDAGRAVIYAAIINRIDY